jgi:hypothetical protein
LKFSLAKWSAIRQPHCPSPITVNFIFSSFSSYRCLFLPFLHTIYYSPLFVIALYPLPTEIAWSPRPVGAPRKDRKAVSLPAKRGNLCPCVPHLDIASADCVGLEMPARGHYPGPTKGSPQAKHSASVQRIFYAPIHFNSNIFFSLLRKSKPLCRCPLLLPL